MQHLLRLAAAFSLALSALALSEKELKANFEFDFDTFDFKDSDYKEKPPDVGTSRPSSDPSAHFACSTRLWSCCSPLTHWKAFVLSEPRNL